MPKKHKRSDASDRNYPDDWVVMHIGKAAAPGTPVGRTCVLPFEKIKHLLTDVPLARPGDPVRRTPKTAMRRRAKRRRS